MKTSVFPIRPRHARAFTLVEMVITMVIFVLLAGAVFGIISGVLESAGILQDDQNRRDEIMALQEFLRHNLNGLPGAGRLNSYVRGDGEGLALNGIIFGTSGLFTAIDAKREPNGLYTLRLARFSASEDNTEAINVFAQAVTGDDESLNWRDLVHDVKSVGWKFMAVDNTQWSDAWPLPNSQKPNILQFTVLLTGENESSATDVWIPPISVETVITSNNGSNPSP